MGVFIIHVTPKPVKNEQTVAQTRIPLSGSLKLFLFINPGEAEEQQCQLFEPEGRVWRKASLRAALPGGALDLSKNVSEQAKRYLGNSL
jgi:hypothetical protein